MKITLHLPAHLPSGAVYDFTTPAELRDFLSRLTSPEGYADRSTEQHNQITERSAVAAYLLWEQGVAGSSPAAPTSPDLNPRGRSQL